MSLLSDIIKSNNFWITRKLERKPSYFKELAKGQSPQILWIGCSDSRVVPNLITGREPGEIFVHRNIANLIKENDPSVQSVIQYAVNMLQVKFVIVCGHYNCGGVEAALLNAPLEEPVSGWIAEIKETERRNQDILDGCDTFQKKSAKLVELNVIQQTKKIRSSKYLENKKIEVLSWVYDISSGCITDLAEKYPRTAFQPEESEIKEKVIIS